MNWVDIGRNIRAKRKEAKITQADLGQLIGKTESSVRKYEKGIVSIPADVLEVIADSLNATTSDLLGINWEDAPSHNNTALLPASKDECMRTLVRLFIEETYGPMTETDILERSEGSRTVSDFLYVVRNQHPRPHEGDSFILTSSNMSDLVRASLDSLSAVLPILIDRMKDFRPLEDIVGGLTGVSDLLGTPARKE